jgi:hypothetical protein
MLRLDLTDGTVLGFTDHDKVLAFDLGDDAGTVDYRPDFGMQVSNIQTGIGLDAGNYEVTLPVMKAPRPTTRAAFAGGRFRRCEARLFEVIWSKLTAGPRLIMFGNAGEWRIKGDKAIAEVRDQRDADYADQIECFATPTEISATVTAGNELTLTVAYAGGPYADGSFDRGTVIGLTGSNAGLKAPIWSWNDNGDGTADIELFMPLVEAPAVADTFTIRDGCARTRPACMAHGQILNARACFDVPGHKALKPAVPAPSQPSGKK